MGALLKLIGALSSVDLKRVGTFVWELVGEPKEKAVVEKRAKAFRGHLMVKHPEWKLPDVPDEVLMLAMFYALRCAAKGTTCGHKP